MSGKMTGRDKDVLATVQAWKEASRQLGIRVIAPFVMTSGNATVACVAFLPDFGGEHGIVVALHVPPEFVRDKSVVDCATASGFAYSFLNPEIYGAFDAEVFKEALEDWGYFGSDESRPSWLMRKP